MYSSLLSPNHHTKTPAFLSFLDASPRTLHSIKSNLRHLNLPISDTSQNLIYSQQLKNPAALLKNLFTKPIQSKSHDFPLLINTSQFTISHFLRSFTNPKPFTASAGLPKGTLHELHRGRASNTLSPFFVGNSTLQAPKAIHSDSSELRCWLTSFGAAFFSGTVARTTTAPFDRLKFIYQLYYKGSDKPPSLSKGFQELYRRDGFRGLFRGNLVCIMKASPETSIRLTIFEKLKSLIKDEKTGTLSKGKLFLAGGMSGAFANFVIFPMDVLRTRLAATSKGVYDGIFDAIRKISKTEGPIRPFYRGLNAGLTANLPTSGLNLMLYETFKEVLATETQAEKPCPAIYMLLAGASALVTCSFLYPLQVVASRQIMQISKTKDGSGNKGMIQQIKGTYKSEGVRGFYKGFSPATSKVMLGNAMSFGCFEVMKRIFGIEFKKH